MHSKAIRPLTDRSWFNIRIALFKMKSDGSSISETDTPFSIISSNSLSMYVSQKHFEIQTRSITISKSKCVIYQVLLHETFIRSKLWTNNSRSYKEKVLVQSVEHFNLTWHHFTDCNHIWLSGLSHIPCSHSHLLTHSQKQDNAFCTCLDFVYAFSCDLKVRFEFSLRSWRSYGLEILCKK